MSRKAQRTAWTSTVLEHNIGWAVTDQEGQVEAIFWLLDTTDPEFGGDYGVDLQVSTYLKTSPVPPVGSDFDKWAHAHSDRLYQWAEVALTQQVWLVDDHRPESSSDPDAWPTYYVATTFPANKPRLCRKVYGLIEPADITIQLPSYESAVAVAMHPSRVLVEYVSDEEQDAGLAIEEVVAGRGIDPRGQVLVQDVTSIYKLHP